MDQFNYPRREVVNSPGNHSNYAPLPSGASITSPSATPPSPLPSPFNPPFSTNANSNSPSTSRLPQPSPPNGSQVPAPSSRFMFPDPTTSAPSTLSNPNRFQEALASLPTNQLKRSPAANVTPPSPDSPKFRFPPEVASPNENGDRAFDTLRRELDDHHQLGSSALFGNSGIGERRRGGSPDFGRSGYGNEGRGETDEPNGGGTPARELEYGEAHEGIVNGMLGGFGRPASMDMGDSSLGDSSFDFLLSPPPSFDPSSSTASRQFAAAAATETIRAKDRSRDRTFPAPLLLKADRPFGGINQQTSPMVAPSHSNHHPGPPQRNTSNNHVPSSSTFTFASSSNMSPSLSNSSSSSRPWAYQPSNVFPGPPSISSTTSATPLYSDTRVVPLPYRQNRKHPSIDSSHPSSSASASQSSIFYSHSPTVSNSSITTGASLATGGSNGSYTSAQTANHSIVSPTAAPNIAATSASTSVPSPLPSNLAPGSFNNAAENPISSQDLLLVIMAMRSKSNSQAQATSLSQSHDRTPLVVHPLFSNTPSSSHTRITSGESATSVDNEDSPTTRTNHTGLPPSTEKLDTVDLSNHKIAEVPIEVIDELRDEVEKLALGYNLLRDLPMHFSVLGNRLRYLNVRVNMLTSFPQVLCELPSLEILDISRNKIKRMPAIPGTLINLKVLSIAKNRIRRLPEYLASMPHLRVLKLDHNPLEWPPKEVTAFPDTEGKRNGTTKNEDAEEMQRWLPNLVKWIQDNAPRIVPPSDDERGAASFEERSIDLGRSAQEMTRTGSGRLLGASHLLDPPRPRSPRTASPQTPLSATVSVESDDKSRPQHSRNASLSTTQSLAPPEYRPSLNSKKSLPDLRQSHADILAERRTGVSGQESGRSNLNLRRLREDRPTITHSASARAVPTASNLNLNPNGWTPQPRSQSARGIGKAWAGGAGVRNGSPSSTASVVPSELDPSPPAMKQKPRTTESSPPGLDRNSGAYFRRLSMLPASTISKTVPASLLEFADAIRGILFSLSQIYTALRQFGVFASQDRLPAPLARLMGTADGSMSLLINALDRFDSLSRRGTPNPIIVRDIFSTCRNNVVTFGKLVAALGPHLKALVATADVRYTRTLLLMLYGSMGEIAKSWNAVMPLLEAMPTLGDDPSLATLILSPPTPSPTLSNPSAPPSRPGTAGPGLYRVRSKTRRHAGSFSVEDVQLGAVIPPAATPLVGSFSDNSFGLLPPTPTFPPSNSPSAQPEIQYAYSSSSTTLKARPPKSSSRILHSNKPTSIRLPSQPGHRDLTLSALENPMTPGGAFSMLHDADGMAPPLPASSNTSRTSPTSRSPDEMALEMMETTTKLGSEVYRMVLDSFDEFADGENDDGEGVLMRELGPRLMKELTDICILGNETTTKLKSAMSRVRNGIGEGGGGGGGGGRLQFSEGDATRLAEETWVFVQTVIRVHKLVKAISSEHGFAPRIRDSVNHLATTTRELSRLILNTNTSFRHVVTSSSSSNSNLNRL